MNFLDCAYDILKKADMPLHYTEITRRALAGEGDPEGVSGQPATGWKAVDGWFFWKYEHPKSGEWRAIDDLRAGRD